MPLLMLGLCGVFLRGGRSDGNLGMYFGGRGAHGPYLWCWILLGMIGSKGYALI